MIKKMRGVHANLGVVSKYNNQLWDLIQLMADDVEKQLLKAWDSSESVIGMATDARSVDRIDAMRAAMNATWDKWANRFLNKSEKIANTFTRSMKFTTENAMKAALKAAGWTIAFKPSPAALQAYAAVLSENVATIKNIPNEFMGRVESIVWSNIKKGYDRGQLAKDLHQQVGITEKRAKRIANQQARMAKSTFENVRRKEIGITEAIWRHSHGGKEPRPSHVKADGTRYKLDDGLVLDGVRTWPGVEIGCKCFSEAILPDISR